MLRGSRGRPGSADRERGRHHDLLVQQSDENLRKDLTHPLTSIITDGLMTEGKPPPRTFGIQPTFLGEYVRDQAGPGPEGIERTAC